MTAIQFSELEFFNLTLLLAMRDSISRDAMMACGQFGLREEDAQYLGSLSTTQILATVANVGPQALFTPRADLFSVMRSPLPLASPLAAVRPPAAVHPRAAGGVGTGAGAGTGTGAGASAALGAGTVKVPALGQR